MKPLVAVPAAILAIAGMLAAIGIWMERDKRLNRLERLIMQEVRIGMEEATMISIVGRAHSVQNLPGNTRQFIYGLANGNQESMVVETWNGKVTRLFIQGS